MNGAAAMMAQVDWTMLGALVAVLAPLGAGPAGLILLYLRTLREAQNRQQQEWGKRMELVECRIEVIRRDYATKEEWVREAMHARKQLERLTEMTAKIETQLAGNGSIAAQMTRAMEQMVRLHGELVKRVSAED